MSNLPGNPFAEGPDNYRETLHELGKSHLAYEISATLALAYEQRTANLIAYTTLATQIQLSDVTPNKDLLLRGEMLEARIGLGDK